MTLTNQSTGRLSNVSSNGAPRRLSTSSGRRSINSEDEHEQDWTITTAEKDSWANRERRRSSVWNKIDSYPTIKPSSSPTQERHGSILSLFQHGKNKHGKDVLHSGENVEHWGGDDLKREDALIVPTQKKGRSGSKVQERKGSVLSMWAKGKDENGRDVLLQG